MTPIWIMVVVAVLAILQTIYYNRFGLRKVSYTRRFSRERVFEGEKVELVEVLANDKPVPVPWVRVESRISGDLQFRRQENMGLSMDRFHKSLFYLGGFSKITRRHEITGAISTARSPPSWRGTSSAWPTTGRTCRGTRGSLSTPPS